MALDAKELQKLAAMLGEVLAPRIREAVAANVQVRFEALAQTLREDNATAQADLTTKLQISLSDFETKLVATADAQKLRDDDVTSIVKRVGLVESQTVTKAEVEKLEKEYFEALDTSRAAVEVQIKSLGTSLTTVSVGAADGIDAAEDRLAKLIDGVAKQIPAPVKLVDAGELTEDMSEVMELAVKQVFIPMLDGFLHPVHEKFTALVEDTHKLWTQFNGVANSHGNLRKQVEENAAQAETQAQECAKSVQEHVMAHIGVMKDHAAESEANFMSMEKQIDVLATKQDELPGHIDAVETRLSKAVEDAKIEARAYLDVAQSDLATQANVVIENVGKAQGMIAGLVTAVEDVRDATVAVDTRLSKAVEDAKTEARADVARAQADAKVDADTAMQHAAKANKSILEIAAQHNKLALVVDHLETAANVVATKLEQDAVSRATQADAANEALQTVEKTLVERIAAVDSAVTTRLDHQRDRMQGHIKWAGDKFDALDVVTEQHTQAVAANDARIDARAKQVETSVLSAVEGQSARLDALSSRIELHAKLFTVNDDRFANAEVKLTAVGPEAANDAVARATVLIDDAVRACRGHADEIVGTERLRVNDTVEKLQQQIGVGSELQRDLRQAIDTQSKSLVEVDAAVKAVDTKLGSETFKLKSEIERNSGAVVELSDRVSTHGAENRERAKLLEEQIAAAKAEIKVLSVELDVTRTEDKEQAAIAAEATTRNIVELQAAHKAVADGLEEARAIIREVDTRVVEGTEKFGAHVSDSAWLLGLIKELRTTVEEQGKVFTEALSKATVELQGGIDAVVVADSRTAERVANIEHQAHEAIGALRSDLANRVAAVDKTIEAHGDNLARMSVETAAAIEAVKTSSKDFIQQLQLEVDRRSVTVGEVIEANVAKHGSALDAASLLWRTAVEKLASSLQTVEHDLDSRITGVDGDLSAKVAAVAEQHQALVEKINGVDTSLRGVITEFRDNFDTEAAIKTGEIDMVLHTISEDKIAAVKEHEILDARLAEQRELIAGVDVAWRAATDALRTEFDSEVDARYNKTMEFFAAIGVDNEAAAAQLQAVHDSIAPIAKSVTEQHERIAGVDVAWRAATEVLRTEFTDFTAAVDAESKNTKQLFAAISEDNKAAAGQLKEVHDSIEPIVKSVSELVTGVAKQATQIVGANQDIQTLSDRIGTTDKRITDAAQAFGEYRTAAEDLFDKAAERVGSVDTSLRAAIVGVQQRVAEIDEGCSTAINSLDAKMQLSVGAVAESFKPVSEQVDAHATHLTANDARITGVDTALRQAIESVDKAHIDVTQQLRSDLQAVSSQVSVTINENHKSLLGVIDEVNERVAGSVVSAAAGTAAVREQVGELQAQVASKLQSFTSENASFYDKLHIAVESQSKDLAGHKQASGAVAEVVDQRFSLIDKRIDAASVEATTALGEIETALAEHRDATSAQLAEFGISTKSATDAIRDEFKSDIALATEQLDKTFSSNLEQSSDVALHKAAVAAREITTQALAEMQPEIEATARTAAIGAVPAAVMAQTEGLGEALRPAVVEMATQVAGEAAEAAIGAAKVAAEAIARGVGEELASKAITQACDAAIKAANETGADAAKSAVRAALEQVEKMRDQLSGTTETELTKLADAAEVTEQALRQELIAHAKEHLAEMEPRLLVSLTARMQAELDRLPTPKNGEDARVETPLPFEAGKQYELGDWVSHKAGVWVAARRTTTAEPGDGHDWDCVVPGVNGVEAELQADGRTVEFKFTLSDNATMVNRCKLPIQVPRGVYRKGTSYEHYDLVQHDGSTWMAVKDGVLDSPRAAPDSWKLQNKRGKDGNDYVPPSPPEIKFFRGTWQPDTAYKAGEIVEHTGVRWLCTMSTTDRRPPFHTLMSDEVWTKLGQ